MQKKPQMAPDIKHNLFFHLFSSQAIETDRNLCARGIMSNIFVLYQLSDC